MSKGNDLIERLLNPMWVHMRGGEPYLDDEATLADLTEAASTIASLSEALAEAEKKGAEDGWMPIETAPRDAEVVLITGGTWLYSESFADGMCDWTAIATFDPNASGNHKWNGGNGTEYDGIYWHNPTHWRPLPPPPRDLSQGGQP